MVGRVDGTLQLQATHQGPPEDAVDIGYQVAEKLLAQGAQQCL